MQLRDVIEKRVSVRQFRREAVPPADVREMVRLASLAPSPNNQQPWRFIAVSRPALLREMADAAGARVRSLLPEPSSDDARRAREQVERSSTFFADAPLVVAVTKQPYEAVIEGALAGSAASGADINAMRGYPDIQSVAAAVEHLLLAATDLGYGACWMCGPLVARHEIEALLGIHAPQQLTALVAIGRPADVPTADRERMSVDDILRFID